MRRNPLRIWISASPEDRAARDTLVMYLQPLVAAGRARVLHEGEILAGADRDQSFQVVIADSDIVVLLVSPHFVASRQHAGRELDAVLAERRERAFFIYPVLLSPCLWTVVPGLADLAHWSGGTRALSEMDPAYAWSEVAREIHRICGEQTGGPASGPSSRSGSAARDVTYQSVYLSYSHLDRDVALRLHGALMTQGVACWLDEFDLVPGERLLDAMHCGIRKQDRLLLLCSRRSLDSWWVKDEIRKAMERERQEARDIIIPILLDRCLLDNWEDGLAADLRSRFAPDFSEPARFDLQVQKVLRALRHTGDE